MDCPKEREGGDGLSRLAQLIVTFSSPLAPLEPQEVGYTILHKVILRGLPLKADQSATEAIPFPVRV